MVWHSGVIEALVHLTDLFLAENTSQTNRLKITRTFLDRPTHCRETARLSYCIGKIQNNDFNNICTLSLVSYKFITYLLTFVKKTTLPELSLMLVNLYNLNLFYFSINLPLYHSILFTMVTFVMRI